MSDPHRRISTHDTKYREALAAVHDQQSYADEALAHAVQNVRAALAAMKDRLDARVGMGLVGRHSSGKSKLVNALLGASNLLPVAVRATTGNVTELELVAGPPGVPTATVAGPMVEFLGRDEVESLAQRLVEALIAASGVDGADDAALRARNPVADGFATVDGWLRRNWPAATETRRVVAARELLDLRDAVLLGPSLIGALPIDVAAADEAVLTLPKDGDRPHPARFREVSGSPLDLDTLRRLGDPDRRVFPLIKRVRYRIAVDPDVWPLPDLPGAQPVVLLDFPGLDGGVSPTRDEFLTVNEFRDIHTAAACMDPHQLAGTEPARIQEFLSGGDRTPAQRDRSLFLIVTKFDAQPVPDLPDSAPPFTDGALELIDNHRRAAVQGDHDRVALVSAVQALLVEGGPEPETPEERTEFADHCAGARDRLPRWLAVAARMRRDQPTSGWPDLLEAAARDGGMQRLRDRLLHHVATHGTSIKADWLDQDMAHVITALRRVRTAEVALSWSESEKDGESARQYLTSVTRAARIVRERAADLADTSQIEKQLISEAVDQVYQWPIWGGLLDRIEPRDAFVVPVTRAGGDSRYDRTEPLLREFTSLVTDLARFAGDHYHTHTQEVFDALDECTEPLRTRWDADLEADLAALLPQFCAGDLTRADAATDAMETMRTLRTVLEAEATAAMDAMEAEAADPDSFPLRQAHHLPWSPRAGAVAEETHGRHQSVVLRMRANVADAAAEVACELVRGMAVRFADAVRARAAGILADVPPPGSRRTSTRPRPHPRPRERAETAHTTIAPGPVARLLAEWGVA